MITVFILHVLLNSAVKSYNNTTKSLDIKFQSFVSIEDKSPVNFKAIIDENKRIRPLPDICALRVYGGVKGDLKSVPYQISLVRQFRSIYASFCGGALITLAHVMSAAHCFTDPRAPHYSEIYAIAGSALSHHLAIEIVLMTSKSDVQYRKLKDVYIHNKFKESTLWNDIAIFEVNENFVKTQKVQPIRLHTDRKQASLRDGTRCLVSGYGKISEVEWSNKLMMACLPLISRTFCESIYTDVYLTKENFCAGEENKNTCLGDSGGPIACHGILVGISSFGLNCSIEPAVYTRVLSYTAEINEHKLNPKLLEKLIEIRQQNSSRSAVKYHLTLNKLFFLLPVFLVL